LAYTVFGVSSVCIGRRCLGLVCGAMACSACGTLPVRAHLPRLYTASQEEGSWIWIWRLSSRILEVDTKHGKAGNGKTAYMGFRCGCSLSSGITHQGHRAWTRWFGGFGPVRIVSLSEPGRGP